MIWKKLAYSISTSILFLPQVLPLYCLLVDNVIFEELDVFKALRSLDTSKARGCDGVSPMVLKHCAMAINQPLYHLFSLSISQFYIPLEWRTHLVKPVYKSGDKSSVRNYRPISLLCIVSKILEKIVYDNIVEQVTQATSVHQFGFLRGCSTLQQLLLFYHQILTSESQSDVVYLDFKKPLTLWRKRERERERERERKLRATRRLVKKELCLCFAPVDSTRSTELR